ncbi:MULTISPECIES: putative ATP-grasp-modified RiPP [Streptomyces]|uniref:ATP-grasp-modified RiPP n=1 Tax=Streptomyces chengmaiensis TaxID=3040919 RepID=A0ABT6HNG7_9ACTN|nr:MULTISPECIES: putative ATP-grasp-modified RiPP [Streptomyces]MDH2390269.1 putative ATP-grasp-modified RiPP [Streptomyces chengmaiensis]WRQ78057.1 putative ATP-grasp-modified RiPP [Streptomyces sp. MUM 178J]
MRPFVLNYVRPAEDPAVTAPYTYDSALQLNVLPDGRPAILDRTVLLATGTTTSTAGSKTHFDD